MPDLNGYSHQSVKQYLDRNRITTDKITAGAISAVINNFVNKINKNNLGLLVNGKYIYIIEINGDYIYYRNNFGGQGFLSHRRSVKIIKILNRDNLSPKLRSALKSGRQVADISKYYNDIYKLGYNKEIEEKNSARAEVLAISYSLRPDFNIKFNIPSDMTKDETQRLETFINTLYFKKE